MDNQARINQLEEENAKLKEELQSVKEHLKKYTAPASRKVYYEKTKEKERTTTTPRKNPFQPAPNTDPRPKGAGTKEREKTKEKEKTTTPTRRSPFQPAPNTETRPKGELPSYLSFGKMNIKLKGE